MTPRGRSGTGERRALVLLSGCGVHDGTEVHEAAAVALALDRAGVSVEWASPNIALPRVIDHHRGAPSPWETRNALVESERIARGSAVDLGDVATNRYAVLLIPGGHGAARVLCDHGVSGRTATVHPEVERVIREARALGCAIGAACLGVVPVARVLGREGVKLAQVGDTSLGDDLRAWGANPVAVGAREVVVDRAVRVVSTPAFTATDRFGEVFEGIDRMVRAALELSSAR